MRKRVLPLTLACGLLLSLLSTTQDASARPGGGSIRYSGGSAPVRYQKPMNTPGYSAAKSSSSTPSRYQRPANSGPGTRAYRRASDYYYYPGSAGYGYYDDYGDEYQGEGLPGYETKPRQSVEPTAKPSRPPETGDVVSRLPSGYQIATLEGEEYYCAQGVFYVEGQQKKTFEAVTPPLGLTVSELPPGTTQVKNGLYQFRNVYYRPAYENGELVYVVSNP